MRKSLLVGISIFCLSVTAHAQISFRSSDEIAKDPYVACKAWFGMSDTIYATPDAPNDPKVSTRFRYYADKFKKEQGHENVNTDCLSFTQMADSLRQSYTPGYSYYNSLWKRQVTIARFPGLPSDWATRPVPGEDGDKKDAPEDAGDLRTITFRFAKGYPKEPGYDFASIDVKYRFLACMGEVHVAYSLDSKSVRTGETYHSRNGLVPVGDVKTPEPSAIDMVAYVYPNPGSRQLGPVVYKDYYGKVADKSAAPALGYGCFTGQTQKIGRVADIVGGKHEPAKLNAILNDALVLGAVIKGFPSLKTPLRNAALDDAKTSMQRAEEERAAQEREQLAQAEAAAAEHRARMEEYEKGVQAAEAAKREFEQKQAIHQAELQKVRAAEEEYQRQRQVYREQYKLATGQYPAE